MGADHVYCTIPFCELTAERKAACIAVIDNWDFPDLDEEDVPDRRRQLIEFLDDYPTYDERRDVSHTEFDYMALSSGGMSWGDDPTDAFTMFAMVDDCTPLYKQLETCAKEDYRPILLKRARKSNDWAVGMYSPSTGLFIDLKDTESAPVSGTNADRLYALSAPLMEWVKRYETAHSISEGGSSDDSVEGSNLDRLLGSTA